MTATRYNYPQLWMLHFFLFATNPPHKDLDPHTMQERTRSFLDIKSLFQSSKRPRTPNPAKIYHYKKRELSNGAGPNQSTEVDENTTYILQRSLMDSQLSSEATIFRQLSVKDAPSSPRTRQSSLRSSSGSSGSSGVLQPDAMSSADSLVTLSPARFRRSVSPQPPLRRGGISPSELTSRPHTPSGLSAPPFSAVAQQTQSVTPNTGDISYCRPTPFAYPSLKNRRSSSQNRPSVEVQRPPTSERASRVTGPIESSPSLHSRHEPNKGGHARPAMHHGYRDRMLVHASVNKNWGTQ